MSAIKFDYSPNEVTINLGDGEAVVTFTADQALNVAAKLAGYAYRARGEAVDHIAIIPANGEAR